MKTLLVSLIVLVFAAAPAGANMVVDGSFEGLAGPGWTAIAEDGETFGAWTAHILGGNAIYLYKGSDGLPAEGTIQCHMAGGYSAAHITQLVSGFEIGGRYKVELAATAYVSPDHPGGTVKVTNVATGVDDLEEVFAAPYRIFERTMLYSIFVFTASNTELELAIFNPGGFATNVDDISIVPLVGGLDVQPAELIVYEEGETTDTFTIALFSQPTDNVTVTMAPETVDIKLNAAAAGAAVDINFTSSDWDTPQTVTVKAVDDTEAEGQDEIINILLSSSSDDPNFEEDPAGSVSVKVVENDIPAVTLTLDDPNGLSVGEEGPGSDDYTVVLDYGPTNNVTIYLEDTSKPDQVSIVPGTLVFTAGNWDTPQTVTVTAIDDSITEYDPHHTEIRHTVESADAAYHNMVVDNVDVVIAENDCGAWGYLPEDLNHDCYVDMLDLKMLAGQWLEEEINEKYDLFEDDEKFANFRDFVIFASYWQDNTCQQPDWCGGSDFDQSGVVDSVDLMMFAENWLRWVVLLSDLNEDEVVNFYDFALFADDWLDCTWPNIPGLECVQLEPEGILGPPRAFPGAEGSGAYAVGGRGGEVIFVDNLDDSGPGSLRAACEASGPRTVVFRVGGTIELSSYLVIPNPYITIAGQTAPGDGICLKNYGLFVYTDDAIIRYLHVRAGDEQHGENDALQILASENVIIDHSSVSWGNDETLSVVVSSAAPQKLKNVTVQWCIISEGLDYADHSMGSAIDAKDDDVTFHHNLFAHNVTRNPRVGGYPGHYINFDFRNNLIYNWGTGASAYCGGPGEGTMNINYIGNYNKPGPSTGSGYWSEIAFLADSNTAYIYGDGNYMYGCPTCTDDSMIDTGGVGNRLSAPFAVPEWDAVTTYDAQTAYEQIISSTGAGDTAHPRDAVDTRIINDVIDGTGAIINSQNEVGGWPTYNSGTPYPDSDQDGMDDDWEVEHGLDPSNPDDHSDDRDGDGYTNLEEFLNSLVM